MANCFGSDINFTHPLVRLNRIIMKVQALVLSELTVFYLLTIDFVFDLSCQDGYFH